MFFCFFVCLLFVVVVVVVCLFLFVCCFFCFAFFFFFFYNVTLAYGHVYIDIVGEVKLRSHRPLRRSVIVSFHLEM